MSQAIHAERPPRHKRRPPATPPVIHPNALYTRQQVIETLGISEPTLRREVRAGKLQHSDRAGRWYFLGSYLLAYIEGGKVASVSPNGATHHGSDQSP